MKVNTLEKEQLEKRIKQIQNLVCPRKQFDINSIYIFLNFILHISKSKWRKEIIWNLFTLKPFHASLNVQIESEYFGCSSFQLSERELMIRSLDSLSH